MASASKSEKRQDYNFVQELVKVIRSRTGIEEGTIKLCQQTLPEFNTTQLDDNGIKFEKSSDVSSSVVDKLLAFEHEFSVKKIAVNNINSEIFILQDSAPVSYKS